MGRLTSKSILCRRWLDLAAESMSLVCISPIRDPNSFTRKPTREAQYSVIKS